MFNPFENTVQYSGTSSRIVVETLAEYDDAIRFPGGASVICEVAGPSVNRIIIPPMKERDYNKTYGSNHVVTPVLIKKIIYQGEELTLVEGETINLMEHYFYVTEETPDQLEYHSMYTIITHEYEPMEQGRTYLVYMHNNASNEMFHFNGEPIMAVAGLREGVYDLTGGRRGGGGRRDSGRGERRERRDRQEEISIPPLYDRMWDDAMEEYGALVDELVDDI
jgi:hypothetical protein